MKLPRRKVSAVARLLCTMVLSSSCIYDADERCGRNEVIGKQGLCVCAQGSVPHPRDLGEAPSSMASNDPGREGCDPCGEHTSVEGSACACDPGFGRVSLTTCGACGANQAVVGETCACVAGYAENDEGDCEKVVRVTLGADCTENGDCGEGQVCMTSDMFLTETRNGYCTLTDCETTFDCPADDGFRCDMASGPKSFCRRPPTGEGDACEKTSSASAPMSPDCAGEAFVCSPLTLQCTSAESCTTDADCTPGLGCCDLTATGLPQLKDVHLCMDKSSCPS